MEQEGALSVGLAALCDEARRNAWTEGTRTSYATGWNQWSIYCGIVDANPNCVEHDGRPMSLPRTIELVANYVYNANAWVLRLSNVMGSTPETRLVSLRELYVDRQLHRRTLPDIPIRYAAFIAVPKHQVVPAEGWLA